jgi:outer membrane protein assembly factor BamB
VHLSYPNFSGTLATSGGLVFLALLDGTVAAFDDTTLDQLWKINVGSGFSAPPMTFEVNGKQYIAIVSGPSPGLARAARQYAGTQGAAQRSRALRLRALSHKVMGVLNDISRRHMLAMSAATSMPASG